MQNLKDCGNNEGLKLLNGLKVGLLALTVLLSLSSQLKGQQSYCSASSNCSGFAFFLDGISMNNLSRSGTGCSSNGYQHYTAQPINVKKGATYTLTLNTSYQESGHELGVWADFNNDTIFGTNQEWLGAKTSQGFGGKVTYTITIPSSAATGKTRMRIKLHDFCAPVNANNRCGSTSGCGFGEVEDYELNIQPSVNCNPPYHLATTNLTNDSITLFWNSGNGGSQSWDVEYGPTGFSPGNGSIVNSVDTIKGLTGLAPNQSYDFYVRENCSSSDSSTFSGPRTFCGTYEAPFTEGMENASIPRLPQCWQQYNNISEKPVTQSSQANSGSNSLAMDNGSSTAPGHQLLFISPQLRDLQMDRRVQFYARLANPNTENLIVGTMEKPNFASTFDPVDTFALTTTYQQYTARFDSTPANHRHIAFKHGTSVQETILIDDISYEITPTCPDPSNLNASNIDTSSATLNWQSGPNGQSWLVQYDTSGFQIGNGNIDTSASTSENIAGLNSSSNYAFYVKEICSQDSSNWIGPYTFTTACGAKQATLTQDFETAPLDETPLCWDSLVNVASGSPLVLTSDVITPNTGSNYFLLSNGGANNPGDFMALISPQLSDLTSNNNRVRFYGKNRSGGNYGDLFIVGTMSDKTNASTFTPVDTFNSTNTYQEYIAYFDNVSANAKYFAIKHGATNNDGRLFVDDITYEPIPNCPDPSNLTTTNIEPYSATIGWSSVNSGSTWNVEYGEAGFTYGNGTQVNSSNTNLTIANLDYGTDYDVYVKEFCANGDTSNLVGPLTFTTNCITETIPYTENFSDTLPACWAPFNNASTNPNCGANNTNTLQIDGAAGSIETVELDARSVNELLLTYQYRKGSANCGEALDDNNDSLKVEHWNGNQWIIDTVYGAGSTPTNFTRDSLYIGGGNQDLKIRLRHENSINSPGDGNWNFDSFEVKLDTAACISPTALNASNITSESAAIDWNPLITGVQSWKVQWGPDGFDLGEGDSVITTQKPYTITGLNSNTTYEVYVAGICGPGDTGSYGGPITFTTACDTFNAPYTNDFENSTWSSGNNFDNTGNTIGACWSRQPDPIEQNDYDIYHWGTQNNGTSSGSTGPNNDHTTGNGNFIYPEGSNYNSGDTAYITSPSIDLSGLNDPSAGFWYHMYGNDAGTLIFQISNDGGFTWNTLWSISGQQQSSGAALWIQDAVDLNAYANQVIKVRFAGTDAGINGDMAIDDFEISEDICPAPHDLSISNATDTSADISWSLNSPGGTNQGTIIQWGPEGFDLGQGNSTFASSSPQNLNLSGNSNLYKAYAAQVCSSGDTSVYNGPKEFIPYYCYPDYVNGCNLVRTERVTLSNVSNTNSGCSPNAYSLHTADTIQLRRGVNYNLTLASGTLNNSGMAAWIDYDQSFGFGQNIEYLGNGVASNNGVPFNINFTVPSSADLGHTRLRVRGQFANAPGQEDSCNSIGFGEAEDYIVNIQQSPSCLPPSNLQASNIQTSSADINWTSNGSGTSWLVEWDTVGFTLGQGNTKVVNGNPSTTLSGLSSNTRYDVYVAEICSPGDTSSIKGRTFQFTTACSPSFTANYMQQWDQISAPFPANFVPNCWNTTGNEGSEITLVAGAGGTAGPTSAPNEVRFGSNINFQNGDTALLVSPAFSDLTNYDKWVRFNAAFENGDNANHKLYVGVMDNQSNAGSFEALDTINSTSDGDYQEYTVFLDNGSKIGSKDHVAIAAGSVNSDDIITIDDFTYEPIPSCFKPSNVEVTAIGADTAQVQWTSNDIGSEWQVEYGPLGYSKGTGTVINGITDTLATITGLSEGTTYDVYVREICSAGDTSRFSQRAQLTTGCSTLPAPLTLPYQESFESFSGSYLDSTQFCNVNGGSWKFKSNDPLGRLQFSNANINSNSGNKAATMDVSEDGNLVANDLILTVNMSNYSTNDSIFLAFYHRQYDEENHENDSVWVRGNASNEWIGVYDLFANQLSGPPFYEQVSLNFSEILANAGQSFTSSAQIRFGQQDNFALATDGRSFDDISITTGNDLSVSQILNPVEQCNQTASEPVSIVIKNEGLSTIPADTSFDASYEFNGNTLTENITLDSALAPDDTLVTTFSSTVDLSQEGSSNNFSAWISWSNDNAPGNDTLHRSIEVPIIPQTPTVTADTVCKGSTTSLSATGNNHFKWYATSNGGSSIANGNSLNVPVTSDTTFYVSGLTFQDSCESARVPVNVEVDPNPVAEFSSDTACAKSDLQFVDNSSIESGSINQFNWDLGNGDNANGSSVTSSYASEGNYDVRLTVVSDKGCADSVIKNATAHPLPAANFTSDSACNGNSVQFSDNSTISSGTIDQYLWDLGDGTTTNGSSATHTYANPGSYDVELVTISNEGCSDTITKTSEAHPIPNAEFTSDTTCMGQDVQLVDNSFISDGAISQYTWNLGDGNTATGSSVSHAYNSAGNYNVELAIQSAEGCVDTVTKNAQVNPSPTVDFSSDSSCLDRPIELTDQSTISGGSIDQHTWELGDGNTATGTSVNHLYNTPMNYDVKLVATSQEGCKDSITKNAKVYPLPTADFTSDSACLGNSVNLTENATISDGSINELNWQLGNGDSATGAGLNYLYEQTGNYQVDLMAISDFGCRDTVNKNVQIQSVPTAAFSVPDTCNRDSVQFSNETTFGGNGNNLNYQWSFDDGATSANENPVYVYNDTGTYDVALIAGTKTLGCGDTANNPISVKRQPVASFSKINEESGKATFKPDDTSAAEYEWQFGDGNTSGEVQPTHTYASNDIYDVTLTATTEFGCQQSNTQSVNIQTVGIREIKGLLSFEVHPNPVEQGQEAIISYHLKQQADIQLEVYNAIGKRIETIVSSKQSPGKHEAEFSAASNSNSGIYFIRLQVDGAMQVKRLMQVE